MGRPDPGLVMERDTRRQVPSCPAIFCFCQARMARNRASPRALGRVAFNRLALGEADSNRLEKSVANASTADPTPSFLAHVVVWSRRKTVNNRAVRHATSLGPVASWQFYGAGAKGPCKLQWSTSLRGRPPGRGLTGSTREWTRRASLCWSVRSCRRLVAIHASCGC